MASDGNTDGSTTGSGAESTSESEELGTTRVDFDITVPVFSSDALQVRLVWGDSNITAKWNTDQQWTASADFPVNTTHQLVVTFSDNNGAITLGSFERSYTTGINPSETLQITVDDFDTDRWDSDGDGESNLSESIAGTNPQGGDAFEPVQASLELVPDKTFRISWQPSETAQLYRVLENPDGISGFVDVSGDLDATTLRYDHRVALLRRLDARYIVQACNQQVCVDSQLLLVPNSVAEAVGYFKANDAEERDSFGSNVALSADGTTMAVTRLGDRGVVGSRGERVYVFGRTDGIWQQEAILGPSEQTQFGFGQALGFSANGNVLIIGSPGDILFDDPGNPESDFERRAGAVYVYQRESGNWREQARLVSNTLSGSDELGHSVSISNDGRIIAAGAPGDRDATNCCGRVILFELVDGSWQQKNQLFSQVKDTTSGFGASVSLSGDGTTLAVGVNSQRLTDNAPDISVGAAYVFSRNDTGWEQEVVLTANDAVEAVFFGRNISLDADGDVLAVGAPQWVFGADTPGPIGAAYVFRNTAGNWRQEVRLNTSFAGDYTGATVVLSGDGATLAVSSSGAPFVTLFEYDGVNWLQKLRFNGEVTRSQNETPTALDFSVDQAGRPLVSSNISFATSISISSDGKTLAVGASSDDSGSREINGNRYDNSRNGSGAVFLF